VFASEVFLGEGVESRDGIPEGPCGANVFPCQSGQVTPLCSKIALK
jgi:hypothetical protein